MMKTEPLTLTQEWDKTFPKSDNDRKDIIPFGRIQAFMETYLR